MSIQSMPATENGIETNRQTLLIEMERRPPTVQKIHVERHGLIISHKYEEIPASNYKFWAMFTLL